VTVAATEERAPGGIVDADGRQAVGIATGQGKNLQFAPISTAASGATQLVAAQGGALKIKVVSYVLVASSAVTVKFQQGSTDVTGAMSLAANGGIVVASVAHMFETAANAALNINLGGAVQVSGHIAYFVE
jgi:hypothetical protein